MSPSISVPTKVDKYLKPPPPHETLAMRIKLRSLTKNNTFTYDPCPDHQPRGKPIGSRWVFKNKVNADGSNKSKARLVVKDYQQTPGIDYTETYAPVAILTTFRMVIAFAAWHERHLTHIDVVAAFLTPAIDTPNI